MDFSIYDILKLIGSLGLFLFGMKLMSEALQKVAGDRMRNILAKMTSNRIKGVFTGFLVTSAIQSSSATTVMIVSFVNAGLLSLIGAVGVIMGANIGTTVTAWIISLLGFKISISAFSLPLVGISLPLLFSNNRNRKSWGELIIGFAILFMGLQFLKESIPDIKSNPEIFNFLANYTHLGFLSILLFLGIGSLLTVIIQSSSATIALTLVMCNSGWISFDMAAAMILGENIGTTITANLAALVANPSGKRAARAHFIFNILGVIWMLLLFKFFLKGIDWIMINSSGNSPFEDITAIPIALSIFHTSFNILNTALLIGFAPLIIKIVKKMVPIRDEDEEEFRLMHIDTGLLSTSELSILQAKKEIAVYAKRIVKMFGCVHELFKETNDSKFNKLFSKIDKYEDISDRMEIEIATYLTKVSEDELSKLGSKRINSMLKLISDIESIADSCFNIAITIERKKQKKALFPQYIQDNVNKMFELVEQSLDKMYYNLDNDYSNISITKANEIENKINKYRDKLKKEHLSNIESGKYNYQAGIIYNDIFCESEKLADFVINVSEAVEEANE